MLRSVRPIAFAAVTPLLLAFSCPGLLAPRASLDLPGLEHPVKVVYDGFGVPHLFGRTDTDVLRVQGWLHARDRFWKMDLTRRQVDGTLGELLGPDALGDDIQMRVVGLYRGAERSLAGLAPREAEILQAYADGVNAWIAKVRSGELPLPPEYAALELSAASLRDWTPLDTLSIGRGIAASLSLDIDAGLLEKLQEYCDAGAAADPPYDGAALLFQDVQRTAPMDPSSTVPDATGSRPYTEVASSPIGCDALATPAATAAAGAGGETARTARTAVPRWAVAAAGRFAERAERVPFLAAVMHRSEQQIGSNEWGVAASETVEGRPIIANDPHLSLGTPSEFYENHLVVEDDPFSGPGNVSGVTFPGVPTVILGQNPYITWGATTNPMDVTDLFADKLVRGRTDCLDDQGQRQTFCIESGGALHPVELETASYFLNTPGDGELDNLERASLGLTDPGALVITVPFRSFGPIVDVEDPSIFAGGPAETRALTLQYTGFHATRELLTFRIWARARNLDEFLQGLSFFDAGNQNWAYADRDGNLGYFTSSEVPLRKDLEEGAVAGLPPFFVRDGISGENNWLPDPAPPPDQAIPFQVLPFEEMPQTLNPANGFFVNANNDPAGTSLDNDPLNQRRLGKPDAIYYLNPGYSEGLRSGRITQLVRDRVEGGPPISSRDMRAFQTNTQQRDAELMLPFLLDAFAHAEHPSAPDELAAFAGDAQLTEAVARLSAWDYSTPTGIPQGWDASDVHGEPLVPVSDAEVAASVAATLYNVWRGQLVRRVIDDRLQALGVQGVGSGEALVATHHLLAQTPFTGLGASGVDFFPEPAGLGPDDRRDVVLLAALRAALDRLAGPEFAAAFSGATSLDAYRWGMLHRITFQHELGGSFSLPPYAGFEDLSPQLPGLPRDGGYEVVNASGFSARAQGANEFRFGGGPVRRYVGVAGEADRRFGVQGWNTVPSVTGDPPDATQLRFWLTGDHHLVRMEPFEVDLFAQRVEEYAAPAP